MFTVNTALLRPWTHLCRFRPNLLLVAIEIKFELDVDKAARVAVTTAASYGLRRVSEGTNYRQLAFANAIALIVIIAILYASRPTSFAKKITPLVCY